MVGMKHGTALQSANGNSIASDALKAVETHSPQRTEGQRGERREAHSATRRTRSRGTLPLFRTVARRPSSLERAPAACTRPAVGLARESLDLFPERALIGPLHVAHLRREEV